MKSWGRTWLVILGVAIGFGAGRSLAQGAESTGQPPAPRRFSLEFRDADIKDVLRLLGQENGLNILVGDDIVGKVTVSFKEVTLDQALVSILQSFGYSYATQDGIVVVSSKPTPKPTPDQIVINVKGKLYSLDFRDAEAKDVLRILGQKSGLNIIVGDEVTGKISVSLMDVTLDQALNSILQGFGCSYSTTDGIVLVTRNPNARQFVSRAIKILYLVDANSVGAKDQSPKELEELAISLRPMLSAQRQDQTYREQEQRAETNEGAITGNAGGSASATAYKSEVVSESGASIKVFPRINTLVVTDVPERVEKIAALIKELDKPTPQIKIEARIVEVKDIYQKELGIQWGAKFNADASHGNSPPYAFPNSVSIAGTQGTDPGSYMVNLPATSPVAGVGLSMGHIANVFSLDLKLSAMEKMDKLKILSTPSIMTMQGKEAVIKVGEQLPYTSTSTTTGTTALNTQTIEFKDIVLQLRVVPSVLPDGRVILDLVVNKDTRGADVSIQGQTNFSIDTKSLTTRVLLQDGETGVIGGLYNQQETGSTSQVPLLGRLPLLGWLFRSRGDSKVRNELLIFLTPRIQPL